MKITFGLNISISPAILPRMFPVNLRKLAPCPLRRSLSPLPEEALEEVLEEALEVLVVALEVLVEGEVLVVGVVLEEVPVVLEEVPEVPAVQLVLEEVPAVLEEVPEVLAGLCCLLNRILHAVPQLFRRHLIASTLTLRTF